MKFKLTWIDVPGISLDYYEIWTRKDLMKDFRNFPPALEYLLFPMKKSSFVHIFDENDGMVVMTRIK